MDAGILGLTVTAATVGLVHAAAGPDHYLPFVMLARANRWRYERLLAVTVWCGLGHVLSSLLLAAGVAALFGEMTRASGLQEHQGRWAAYLLLGFGVTYFLWGLRQTRKRHRHSHWHTHADGTVHHHQHDHHDAHGHVHAPSRTNAFWWLFIFFVLGPCEALVPLITTAVGRSGLPAALFIAMVFSLATIGTMLALVSAGHWGLARLRLRFLEQHMHAVTGLVIVACASGILVLDW